MFFLLNKKDFFHIVFIIIFAKNKSCFQKKKCHYGKCSQHASV